MRRHFPLPLAGLAIASLAACLLACSSQDPSPGWPSRGTGQTFSGTPPSGSSSGGGGSSSSGSSGGSTRGSGSSSGGGSGSSSGSASSGSSSGVSSGSSSGSSSADSDGGSGSSSGGSSGSSSGGGASTFGSPCQTNAECTDPVYDECENVMMVMSCTKACASNADCPVPPTVGTCTPKGFCK